MFSSLQKMRPFAQGGESQGGKGEGTLQNLTAMALRNSTLSKGKQYKS